MSLPEFLELPQMQRAFVIALIMGPVGGLLGSFVTLRRMSFFSDALSHGAMTGVVLGFALGIAREVGSPAMQGVLLVFCTGMALLMAFLLERTTLHTDTVIAFSFTGSVALGVVVLSRMHAGARVLESALFGDILASSPSDVWLVAGLAVVALVFLFGNMRALTLSVVQENLARLQGFNMRRVNYLFVALIAMVVAVLLRQMGALLVSGLLVIPAASARLVARTFRGMLIFSSAFGLAGGAAGVVASYYCDTPTGPTIVLAHVAVLAACLAWSWIFGERTQPWTAAGDLEKR
jgi:zinc/manganese transport system permease protein/zinc transport system permease protein